VSAPAEGGGSGERPPDDLEGARTRGRVVEVGLEQEGERLARDRLVVVGAEEPGQVGARGGRSVRVLERPDVEDDAKSRDRLGRGLGAERGTAVTRAPLGSAPELSARSLTTTSSASTMIRRDIFDCPTWRSRKMIGTSRMRAPARLAR
jgi:hypothetical protein